MAVLVEAISVIVRNDSVHRSFEGGWDAFLRTVPDRSYCADGSGKAIHGITSGRRLREGD
jgi:hypothetical protein